MKTFLKRTLQNVCIGTVGLATVVGAIVGIKAVHAYVFETFGEMVATFGSFGLCILFFSALFAAIEND